MENSFRRYLEKTTDAYSFHLWRPRYNNGSYSVIAKSTRALELHYSIIPLLINNNILIIVDTTAAPALYIVFLLFEIYRFMMKMFTHIQNNR